MPQGVTAAEPSDRRRAPLHRRRRRREQRHRRGRRASRGALRADLRRFRAITMGKPLVMGRKTFESIGRVLDGRDNIVVTRQLGLSRPPASSSLRSLDAALEPGEASCRGTQSRRDLRGRRRRDLRRGDAARRPPLRHACRRRSRTATRFLRRFRRPNGRSVARALPRSDGDTVSRRARSVYRAAIKPRAHSQIRLAGLIIARLATPPLYNRRRRGSRGAGRRGMPWSNNSGGGGWKGGGGGRGAQGRSSVDRSRRTSKSS